MYLILRKCGLLRRTIMPPRLGLSLRQVVSSVQEKSFFDVLLRRLSALIASCRRCRCHDIAVCLRISSLRSCIRCVLTATAYRSVLGCRHRFCEAPASREGGRLWSAVRFALMPLVQNQLWGSVKRDRQVVRRAPVTMSERSSFF